MHIKLFSQLLLTLIVITFSDARAQQLSAKNSKLDIGLIESAIEIVYEFTIYNNTNKMNYILKADSPINCFVQIENKKLTPFDSTSIVVTRKVLAIGGFEENIFVYSGNNSQPLQLTIKGKVKNVAVDNLQACHPSVKKNLKKTLIQELEQNITIQFVDDETLEPIANIGVLLNNQSFNKQLKANENGIITCNAPSALLYLNINNIGYDEKLETINTLKNNYFEVKLHHKNKVENVEEKESAFAKEESKKLIKKPTILIDKEKNNELKVDENATLPLSKFKPNHIVFLIDKSASMKEPNKLPQLKIAMHCLIKQLRNVDRISIITYAKNAAILIENIVANDTSKIINSIDTLSAKGQTSGSKGIEKAYEIANAHFINDGNNQIILATDGAFKLSEKDELLFKNNQKITMSVLGFSYEKKDLWQLYKIAKKANGNYIKVTENKIICDELLDEIKSNSLRK